MSGDRAIGVWAIGASALLALPLCGAGALPIGVVQANPAPPSPLALSCLGCHQPSVDSAAMRALDKLPAAHIAAALRRARDAPQPGSIMARFTAKLSDVEIDEVSGQLGRAPGAR